MFGILFWAMLISLGVRLFFRKWTDQSVGYWFFETIIWVGFTAYWIANPHNTAFGLAVIGGIFSALGILTSLISWTKAAELSKDL